MTADLDPRDLAAEERSELMLQADKEERAWLSGWCGAGAAHGNCSGGTESAGKKLRCRCACHAAAVVPDGVVKEGLHWNMPDEIYHGDPVPGGSLSSSLARRLTEHVPAKAIAAHRNRKPTKAMNLGKAAHRHALGAGPELVVWQHDGRTKAGIAERAQWADAIATEQAVAVTAAEREQIEGMVAALRGNPEVDAMLKNGEPEVSAFWRERGAWCRARIDLLGPDANDYKTTEDASDRGFEHDMEKYGYHQQADFYLRGLRALGHEAGDEPMRFICQEKQEPYLVQVHICDELAMEVARALNDRAIDIFAEAIKSGKWDGYPSLHAEPTALPARYFYRYADLIPAHLNPYVEPEMSM